MAFMNLCRVEARCLKLAVYVAGEHCGTERHGVCPTFEDGEPGVRHCLAVQGQAVAVKAPCAAGVLHKAFGVGDAGEVDACSGEGRVSIPKALLAPKVRQAGIHAYSRASGNDQGVGLLNQFGSVFQGVQSHVRCHVVGGPKKSASSVDAFDSSGCCPTAIAGSRTSCGEPQVLLAKVTKSPRKPGCICMRSY